MMLMHEHLIKQGFKLPPNCVAHPVWGIIGGWTLCSQPAIVCQSIIKEARVVDREPAHTLRDGYMAELKLSVIGIKQSSYIELNS